MDPSTIQSVRLALMPIQMIPMPLSHGVKIQPNHRARAFLMGAGAGWPAGGCGQVDCVAPQLPQILVASSTGPEQHSHCLIAFASRGDCTVIILDGSGSEENCTVV